MQNEVQTKGLRKIGILPTSHKTQGGESKEDADKESGEPTKYGSSAQVTASSCTLHH